MEENIKIKQDSATLKINPKIYPLEVIYSAAYTFLDKAYILFDGDPKKEILIDIRPKNKKGDIEEIARDFFNELINYADYQKRAEETKPIREMILQRALFTNDPETILEKEDEEFEKLLQELDDDEDSDDLIVPWENEED